MATKTIKSIQKIPNSRTHLGWEYILTFSTGQSIQINDEELMMCYPKARVDGFDVQSLVGEERWVF